MMNSEIHNISEKTCRTGTITLRSDKVILFNPFNEITTVNLKDAKEMYAIFMELTAGIPHLYYSDNTNMKGLGREERIYMSSKIHHFASAMAMKESSAIVRFITHTIIHLNKPKIPIRMFKTKENAINWLKS